jgi:hypothetical protein
LRDFGCVSSSLPQDIGRDVSLWLVDTAFHADELWTSFLDFLDDGHGHLRSLSRVSGVSTTSSQAIQFSEVISPFDFFILAILVRSTHLQLSVVPPAVDPSYRSVL